MGRLGTELMRDAGNIYWLLKLKMEIRSAQKQIRDKNNSHWAYCYTLLHSVGPSFAMVIQLLNTELLDAVAIFYLVLRALDTVEDDTSIPIEEKVPILKDFHRHMYDHKWQFSCGTDCRILMEQFHHVRAALLDLKKCHQETIEDITEKMGAGMAKFICKEVETIDDYDEYASCASGLVGLGLSKIFHDAGLEDLATESLSISAGRFIQKTNIIRDYLEDINEIPKSRMFWPRQIWSKYVKKLEDLKYEENSSKSLQCLNEMITNALPHVPDCLRYMTGLQDNAILRFVAIPQVITMGTLALSYNNINVFRCGVKLQRGLVARIFFQTRTKADVYKAFFEFSNLIKSKVQDNDPNAMKTLTSIEAIQKICRKSGYLGKRSYREYTPTLIIAFSVIILCHFIYLSTTQPNN
ncbi:squalene synthase-like isoform X1 [Carica papaya]|uniref:squalene synthase-like isoform X1 n=1 Tax=Carica papaya TaxID=3649 RepID=UPI000B8CA11A|nr:squalene synthase-like isoform X1 [Carica papaya]